MKIRNDIDEQERVGCFATARASLLVEGREKNYSANEDGLNWRSERLQSDERRKGSRKVRSSPRRDATGVRRSTGGCSLESKRSIRESDKKLIVVFHYYNHNIYTHYPKYILQ